MHSCASHMPVFTPPLSQFVCRSMQPCRNLTGAPALLLPATSGRVVVELVGHPLPLLIAFDHSDAGYKGWRGSGQAV